MTLIRLKEYIDSKGISVSAFEKSIGMSNASFGKSLKKGGAIGSDKLENILLIYPDLNPTWLLTGRGNMLTDQASQNTEPKEVIIYRSDPKDIEMIELQRKHIKVLEEQLTLCPARLDLDAPSTQSTPIPSLAGPKRAKNQPKPH